MSYSRRGLISIIRQTLHANPSYGLDELATATKTSRRTIQNALRNQENVTFTKYRDAIACDALSNVFSQFPGSSIEEAIRLVGFSSRKGAARMLRRSRGLALSELRDRVINGTYDAPRVA
jgi:AraC-like DNA-binding protein